MTEQPAETLPIRRYESPLGVPWKEAVPGAISELTDIAASHSLVLTAPIAAFKGGGFVDVNTDGLAPGYKFFLESSRPIAVIPAKEEPGGKITDVIHVAKTKEAGPIQYDANLATYKFHVGKYVFEHWDRKNGPSPLPQVRAVEQLPDGRFVTIDRYRPYMRGLGKSAGSLGLHELDTTRVHETDIPRLFDTLDAVHPPVAEFRSWVQTQPVAIPKESLLSEHHPLTALRGQEWWVAKEGTNDRLHELTKKLSVFDQAFAAIDPSFHGKEALTTFLRTNVGIFPHQDGSVDHPSAQEGLCVVHGALNPDNIHEAFTQDRQHKYYTVTGGDRAHIGRAAESVDWLIASAASSPELQQTMIKEFLARHPSDTDKRALAMHTLYRAVSEASWFAKSKPAELSNLAKLSYDIMTGNGLWQGVNLPLANDTTHPLK